MADHKNQRRNATKLDVSGASADTGDAGPLSNNPNQGISGGAPAEQPSERQLSDEELIELIKTRFSSAVKPKVRAIAGKVRELVGKEDLVVRKGGIFTSEERMPMSQAAWQLADAESSRAAQLKQTLEPIREVIRQLHRANEIYTDHAATRFSYPAAKNVFEHIRKLVKELEKSNPVSQTLRRSINKGFGELHDLADEGALTRAMKTTSGKEQLVYETLFKFNGQYRALLELAMGVNKALNHIDKKSEPNQQELVLRLNRQTPNLIASLKQTVDELIALAPQDPQASLNNHMSVELGQALVDMKPALTEAANNLKKNIPDKFFNDSLLHMAGDSYELREILRYAGITMNIGTPVQRS